MGCQWHKKNRQPKHFRKYCNSNNIIWYHLLCPQVISDPAAAKHVLRGTDNLQRNLYCKGLVAEVAEFLFGQGFAISGGEAWRVRRKAVNPAMHRWAGGSGRVCDLVRFGGQVNVKISV